MIWNGIEKSNEPLKTSFLYSFCTTRKEPTSKTEERFDRKKKIVGTSQTHKRLHSSNLYKERRENRSSRKKDQRGGSETL